MICFVSVPWLMRKRISSRSNLIKNLQNNFDPIHTQGSKASERVSSEREQQQEVFAWNRQHHHTNSIQHDHISLLSQLIAKPRGMEWQSKENHMNG